ncbi:MAG: hypothetical protein RL757_1009 [Bacteroidota bacterium]|jgi:hypothetical protein
MILFGKKIVKMDYIFNFFLQKTFENAVYTGGGIFLKKFAKLKTFKVKLKFR